MKKNKIIWKWSAIGILIGIILFVVIRNQIDRQNILKNPFETEARITGIEGCFNSGRCITYEYTFEGETYQGFSSTSWAFSNWCKHKRNCIGFKFKITIDKKNPEKVIADWDAVFKQKEFINFPAIEN